MIDFIRWFKREDNKCLVVINIGTGTCNPIYSFSFQCRSQEEAELLTQHLNKKFDEYREDIAANPDEWIWDGRLSKLKKRLKKWDTRKCEWNF